MAKTSATGPRASQWAAIPSSDTVRRFFPEIAHYKISLEGTLPGRYWKPFNLNDRGRTAFDDKIAELIEGRGSIKMKSRAELARAGIECPFYTWRRNAVLAVFNSNMSYKNLSGDRIKSLKDEIEYWTRHINSSKNVIKSKTHIGEYIGSVNLNDFDAGGESSRSLDIARSERLSALTDGIEQDRAIIVGLNKELNRIGQITDFKIGSNAPDIWYSSFFMWMSNLWKYTTLNEVTENGGFFLELLNTAVDVAYNSQLAETEDYPKWGQAKLLCERFKGSPSGAGFLLGESKFFKETLHDRGIELSNILEVHRNNFRSYNVDGIIKATLAMIDCEPGPLACVMQNIVLKKLLSVGNAYSDRTAIQLGWLPVDETQSFGVLRNLIDLSKRDRNIPSSVVVQMAYDFNPTAKRLIIEKGWPLPFGGISNQEVELYFGRKLYNSEVNGEYSSELKPLKSAVILDAIILARCFKEQANGP